MANVSSSFPFPSPETVRAHRRHGVSLPPVRSHRELGHMFRGDAWAPPTFSSPGLLTLSLATLLAFVHISVDWPLQNDDNMEEMPCHLHHFEILFWMLSPAIVTLFPGIFSTFPGFSAFTQSVALSFLKITDPLVFLTVVCPSSARLVFLKWGYGTAPHVEY